MNISNLNWGKITVVLVLAAVISFTGYISGTAVLDYILYTERVDGTVVSSEIDDAGRGQAVADITYQYEYAGQTYTNDNLEPGAGTAAVSKPRAEQIVSRYPENESVTVYVNPTSPTNSWLKNQFPLTDIDIVVTMLACIGSIYALYRQLTETTDDD